MASFVNKGSNDDQVNEFPANTRKQPFNMSVLSLDKTVEVRLKCEQSQPEHVIKAYTPSTRSSSWITGDMETDEMFTIDKTVEERLKCGPSHSQQPEHVTEIIKAYTPSTSSSSWITGDMETEEMFTSDKTVEERLKCGPSHSSQSEYVKKRQKVQCTVYWPQKNSSSCKIGNMEEEDEMFTIDKTVDVQLKCEPSHIPQSEHDTKRRKLYRQSDGTSSCIVGDIVKNKMISSESGHIGNSKVITRILNKPRATCQKTQINIERQRRISQEELRSLQKLADFVESKFEVVPAQSITTKHTDYKYWCAVCNGIAETAMDMVIHMFDTHRASDTEYDHLNADDFQLFLCVFCWEFVYTSGISSDRNTLQEQLPKSIVDHMMRHSTQHIDKQEQHFVFDLNGLSVFGINLEIIQSEDGDYYVTLCSSMSMPKWFNVEHLELALRGDNLERELSLCSVVSLKSPTFKTRSTGSLSHQKLVFNMRSSGCKAHEGKCPSSQAFRNFRQSRQFVLLCSICSWVTVIPDNTVNRTDVLNIKTIFSKPNIRSHFINHSHGEKLIFPVFLCDFAKSVTKIVCATEGCFGCSDSVREWGMHLEQHIDKICQSFPYRGSLEHVVETEEGEPAWALLVRFCYRPPVVKSVKHDIPGIFFDDFASVKRLIRLAFRPGVDMLTKTFSLAQRLGGPAERFVPAEKNTIERKFSAIKQSTQDNTRVDETQQSSNIDISSPSDCCKSGGDLTAVKHENLREMDDNDSFDTGTYTSSKIDVTQIKEEQEGVQARKRNIADYQSNKAIHGLETTSIQVNTRDTHQSNVSKKGIVESQSQSIPTLELQKMGMAASPMFTDLFRKIIQNKTNNLALIIQTAFELDKRNAGMPLLCAKCSFLAPSAEKLISHVSTNLKTHCLNWANMNIQIFFCGHCNGFLPVSGMDMHCGKFSSALIEHLSCHNDMGTSSNSVLFDNEGQCYVLMVIEESSPGNYTADFSVSIGNSPCVIGASNFNNPELKGHVFQDLNCRTCLLCKLDESEHDSHVTFVVHRLLHFFHSMKLMSSFRDDNNCARMVSECLRKNIRTIMVSPLLGGFITLSTNPIADNDTLPEWPAFRQCSRVLRIITPAFVTDTVDGSILVFCTCCNRSFKSLNAWGLHLRNHAHLLPARCLSVTSEEGIREFLSTNSELPAWKILEKFFDPEFPHKEPMRIHTFVDCLMYSQRLINMMFSSKSEARVAFVRNEKPQHTSSVVDSAHYLASIDVESSQLKTTLDAARPLRETGDVSYPMETASELVDECNRGPAYNNLARKSDNAMALKIHGGSKSHERSINMDPYKSKHKEIPTPDESISQVADPVATTVTIVKEEVIQIKKEVGEFETSDEHSLRFDSLGQCSGVADTESMAGLYNPSLPTELQDYEINVSTDSNCLMHIKIKEEPPDD